RALAGYGTRWGGDGALSAEAASSRRRVTLRLEALPCVERRPGRWAALVSLPGNGPACPRPPDPRAAPWVGRRDRSGADQRPGNLFRTHGRGADRFPSPGGEIPHLALGDRRRATSSGVLAAARWSTLRFPLARARGGSHHAPGGPGLRP